MDKHFVLTTIIRFKKFKIFFLSREYDIAYEHSNSIADCDKADHILEQRAWERFKLKDSGLKEKAVAWV
ncbi:Uncharacterized protein FWK35_00030209 [Aphis craccivora]|uniref:Uncharacterized protein n=1 Tax=Aphis craccivora TaxID=307492 RepID=A0A6G0VM03_APHCR|nr:Uncharacterized protein FWK35_00030209 [Aphis craccivora]